MLNGRSYATAKRMWAEGVSLKRMAYELGVTVGSLKGYAARNREDFPHRRAPKRNYMTTKRLATATGMWAGGATLKEISAETGLTVSYLGQYMSHNRELFPRRYRAGGGARTRRTHEDADTEPTRAGAR